MRKQNRYPENGEDALGRPAEYEVAQVGVTIAPHDKQVRAKFRCVPLQGFGNCAVFGADSGKLRL